MRVDSKHIETLTRIIEQAKALAASAENPEKKAFYLETIAETKKKLEAARKPCHEGATNELPQLGGILQDKHLRGDVGRFQNLAGNNDVFG